MNKPCPSKVNECLPCNDWPLLNLSAEGPDDPTYLAIADWYAAQGCLRWCYSRISQADADACAAAQAAECADPTTKPGGGFVYNQEERIDCGMSGGVQVPMFIRGTLPEGYTTDGYSLILPAGSISVSEDSAPDPQAAANSLARDALRSVYSTLLGNGCIVCGPGQLGIRWALEWSTDTTVPADFRCHPPMGGGGADLSGAVNFAPCSLDYAPYLRFGAMGGGQALIVRITALANIHVRVDYALSVNKGTTVPPVASGVWLITGAAYSPGGGLGVNVAVTPAQFGPATAAISGTYQFNLVAGTSRYLWIKGVGGPCWGNTSGPTDCGTGSGSIALTIT